jgi:hypothetical protein
VESTNETVIVGLVPGAVAMVLAVLFTYVVAVAPFIRIDAAVGLT